MNRTTIQHSGNATIDIGTKVRYPSRASIECIFILTITTAKHATNLITAIDIHRRLWHSGSITATIDRLNTGGITSMDNHVGLLAFCREGCQVSATIGSS